MDVSLFSTQAKCKRALDLVSEATGWSLQSLGITMSQKGLIYGNGTLIFDEKPLIMKYENPAILVPLHTSCKALNVDLVIVLEKDAVFKWFCIYIERLRLSYNLMIITAKGYPDNLTKRFTQSLSLYCPVLAFVDADVYGVCICRSYNTPSMQYYGMFLLDFIDNALDIEERERVMIANLLEKLSDDDSKSASTYKRELTRILFLSKKAELNSCGSNENTQIASYLAKKVDTFLVNSIK